jgi:hypothetical protein
VEIVIEMFLQLIDTTSAEAQRVKSEMTAAGLFPGKQVAADLTVSNLDSLRNLVVTDKLPRPSKGQVSNLASLGLSREIGEWTEDDRLLEAGYAVEEYYRKSV